MSTSMMDESAYLAGKDAASREREDRLENARKKLKKYRARQSKMSSSTTGSSMSSIASSSRRDSSLTETNAASGSGHRHRRSISRNSILAHVPPSPSVASRGHGRRISKSRGSRGSISMLPTSAKKSSHGHTRSRASISISASAPPSAGLNAGYSGAVVETGVDGAVPAPAVEAVMEEEEVNSTHTTPMLRQKSSPRPAGLDAPASWSRSGSFPSSPEQASAPSFTAIPILPATPNLSFSSSSVSNTHTPTISLSTTPNSAPSASASTSNHGRRPSRHSRRSSVANFRESLDLVSGIPQSLFPGGESITPALSSFEPATPQLGSAEALPTSPILSRTSTPSVSDWHLADPARVLEALKERGRRESDGGSEPDQATTRSAALEALEGRVAAPSEIIDLGNEAEGELFIAPPSPGYMGSILPPASPSQTFSSPMPGQGFGTKRSSWGAPGPVTAVGAKGAMDLGMLVEEEEEEDSEDVAPPKKRGASPKKRPASLFVPPSADPRAVAISSPAADDLTPLSSNFGPRPMRLSLSLSSTASSVGTPSTAASPTIPPPPPARPPALRSLTLGSTSLSSPVSAAGPATPPVNERRPLSLFHSVAVETANGVVRPPLNGSQSSPTVRGGLRSLSIGARSPVSPSAPRQNERSFSPTADRRTASTSSAATKRSSISYRTTSTSSLSNSISSPDLSFSGVSPARRTWRNSATLSPVAPATPSTPSSTIGGYAFPFTPSHGQFGGFGDLEVEDTDDELAIPSPAVERGTTPISDDVEVLTSQVTGLKHQVEQFKVQNEQLVASHSMEISEFEKKAGEEARGMRVRISELERTVDEERVQRRFEVEGLTREVEQAREAMADLTDERDSLKEDVDGWRERCGTLQHMLKKDQEDDALAAAQAKLIGEMRDQIYNLVAALERERGEHAETRNEVQRLIEQQQSHLSVTSHSVHSSPRVDEDDDHVSSSRHGFQTASDGSVLSNASSFGRSFSGNTTEDTSIVTDMEDSFSSKMVSSPPSGYSSFGSKRDSELGFGAGVLSNLGTLEEEEEEGSDELPADAEQRVRLGSGSTGSTGTSDGMPPTPNKDSSSHHLRSDSFVRHWSFPKGSVSSLRTSMEEEHTFFDLNRHTSLPALPIAESIFPAFLTAELDVDEDQYQYATYPPSVPAAPAAPLQHARRPSSPRPLDKMAPHTRRYSGQYGKAPPVSPSALVHAAISSASTTSSSTGSTKFGRFGSLIGSLGGWAPGSSASSASSIAATQSKLAIASTREEDEEGGMDFLPTSRHEMPASLLHSSRPKKKYIKASQQPIPRASRLALLDFTPICCSSEEVLVA